MPWYWAGLLSLAAFYLVAVVVLLLSIGWGSGYASAPLGDVLDECWEALAVVVGGEAARYVLIAALATGPWAAALLVYAYLRRGRRAPPDSYLRCTGCGYILHGLSEPRCPECGQAI